MRVKFGDCSFEAGELSITGTFMGTFAEIESSFKSEHSYNNRSKLVDVVVQLVAAEVAKEYLASHKMDLVDSLSKQSIIDAIQLKVVEGFSLQGRQ